MSEGVLQVLTASVEWPKLITPLILSLAGILIVWYRATLRDWKDFWKQVLEGLKAIPELKKDVKGITYFVSPNGGGSLMDSAKRTEVAVADLKEALDLLAYTFAASNDIDDNVGRFYGDSLGANTYVNQTYARWLGIGKAELLGWGFLNSVHPDDVVSVRAHWEQCRKEHRQYRMRHRLCTPKGESFEVDVVSTPVPDSGPAKRWIGTIRKVDSSENAHN